MSDIAQSLRNDIAAQRALNRGRIIYRFSVGHSGLRQGVGFSFDVIVDQEDPDLAVTIANRALAQVPETFGVDVLTWPLMHGAVSLNPAIQVTKDDIVDGPYRYD